MKKTKKTSKKTKAKTPAKAVKKLVKETQEQSAAKTTKIPLKQLDPDTITEHELRTNYAEEIEEHGDWIWREKDRGGPTYSRESCIEQAVKEIMEGLYYEDPPMAELPNHDALVKELNRMLDSVLSFANSYKEDLTKYGLKSFDAIHDLGISISLVEMWAKSLKRKHDEIQKSVQS